MRAPVYAYFYPLSTACPERQARAAEHGVALVDETRLCQQATPLFPGHNQPSTYCLGDPTITNWDDTDPQTMQRQVELAAASGIDGFIFDTYLGQKKGKKSHEMAAVLDKAFLGATALHGETFSFAVMATLVSPRVVLPVPPAGDIFEQNRYYDLTTGTAETIIDHCAKNYWPQNNYIHMKGRPYVSIYVTYIGTKSYAQIPMPGQENAITLADMAGHMKEYSIRTYGEDPYVVGVCPTVDDGQAMVKGGADAITNYCFLPDFTAGAQPVQDYRTLMEQRAADWQEFHTTIGKPYVPSVAIGWDASARGTAGLKLADVETVYPYVPVVQGATPEAFRDTLLQQRNFIRDRVPPDEQHTPVMAWNEITERSAALPRLRSDGTVDDSNLQVIRNLGG